MASVQARLFIEAAPGTGKTTVAAERFGAVRYSSAIPGGLASTALSFTRSATRELRERIVDRWGSSALSWPHDVKTIDAMVQEIVHILLRRGVIHWPGGHQSIRAIDTWRMQRGCRWLEAGSYYRSARIDVGGSVTSVGRSMPFPGFAIGNRGEFHRHLEAGICTHDDLRGVLESALDGGLRPNVAGVLSTSIGHLIVDEVFDANTLDLRLVALACEAGIPVTIVGDPWQALYDFRGARPDLVPDLVADFGFARESLTRSFRFVSTDMQELSRTARTGQPVALATGGDVDVVLASQWNELWSATHRVLPLSFGRIANKTDAAGIVLLDHLTSQRFGQRAVFLADSLLILDLDPDTYRARGGDVLSPVIDTLRGNMPDAATRALSELRGAVRALGARRRPPAGDTAAEARQVARLEDMRRRLITTDRLLPGLTFHQAKGREWDRVGLKLTTTELGRLASGLRQDVEADRGLYVALTRARAAVQLFA